MNIYTKMNIEEIDEILGDLLSKTRYRLSEHQRANCPNFSNMDIEVVESRKFKFLEGRYKSDYPLLKINNFRAFIHDLTPNMYNGRLSSAILSGIIHPFILNINNEFIDPYDCNLILDKRYCYIELLEFGKPNYSFSNSDAPYVLDNKNPNIIELPHIPRILHPHMNLKIIISNMNEVEYIKMNGNLVSNMNSLSLAPILSDDDLNILEIKMKPNVNDQIFLGDIFFYSEVRRKIDINSIKCIVYPNGYAVHLSNKDDFTLNEYGDIYSNGVHMHVNDFKSNKMYSGGIYFEPYLRNRNDIDVFEITEIDKDFVLNIGTLKDHKVLPITIFPYDKYGRLTEITDYGTNTFTLSDDTVYVKAYYYYGNTSVDNMVQYDLIRNILDEFKENNGKLNTYLDPIKEPLDFLFDKNLETKDRIIKLTKVIAKYNPLLLQDYISSKSNVEVVKYNGYKIKNELTKPDNNDKRYFRILRFEKKCSAYGTCEIIVFRNGDLYDYDKIHTDDFYSYIEIDENNIDNFDEFEIMIFKKVNNNSVQCRFEKSKPYLISNYINFDDMILTTDDIDNHIYRYIPKKKELQYDINHAFIDVGNGNVILNTRDYYFNKEVSVSSKRKFIHTKYIINGTETLYNYLYKIILPDDFRYCNNQDQYWVFHNGKKLSQTQALICLNKHNLPFDKRFIHVSKYCKIGDRLDIFYIPDPMRQVYEIKELDNRNGYIEVKKSNIGYNFDGKNCSIFINGKKICHDNILDINPSKIRIISSENVDSRMNVHVLRHIDYSDEIFNIIENTYSDWEVMFDVFDTPDKLDKLFDIGTTINNIDEDIMEHSFTSKQVIMEVIRRYWLLHDYKMKIENPLFYVYNNKGKYVLPIDHSTEMIDVLKLYRKFKDDNDVLNGDTLILNANTESFDLSFLDKPIYQEYLHTKHYTNIKLGNPLLKNIIKLILANGDPANIIKINNLFDNFPIDAKEKYKILATEDILKELDTYNEIDAKVIRPYFWKREVCVESDVANVYPIPIDASEDQIGKLPKLIGD